MSTSKLTHEQFVSRLTGKYTVLNTYVNMRLRIDCLCSVCDHKWSALPQSLLRGSGCPSCAKENRSKSKILQHASFLSLLPDSRDYKVMSGYKKAKKGITLKCKTCNNEWTTTPDALIRSASGCPSCGHAKTAKAKTYSHGQFIQLLPKNKAYRILGDYVGSTKKILCQCDKCQHKWSSVPASLIHGQTGCPKCSTRISKNENQIADFVKSLGVEVVQSYKFKGNSEIDIFVPSHNFGIEFNGLYWHSSEYKQKNSHYDKRVECESLGIKLIQVWEDDWKYKKPIIKKMIAYRLGCAPTIYARKCQLKITSKIAAVRDFYNKNHIQGSPRHGTTCALFFENKIVAAMTFCNPVSLRGHHRSDTKELIRYATSVPVVGGASRLFDNYLRHTKTNKVVTFCDHDYFDGNLYKILGFTEESTSIDYTTVWDKKQKHKTFSKKSNLAKMLPDYDSNFSETENLTAHGIYKIYHSGKTKYIFEVKKHVQNRLQRVR
jgi:hypothetical protein